MKILKSCNIIILATLIALISLPVNAGQLYRFPDENGISTISKILPPSAAQNGYDILDEKSLRLLKRVAPALTPDQIIEQERQLAEQKEAQHLAEIAEKEQQERKRQQAIHDQNLLASYQSEQDLIDARDSDLSYRQTQIANKTEFLSKYKEKLRQLQQQAAEQELSGNAVTTNLSKSLSTTQQEIDNTQAAIERLQTESQELTKQYEVDILRLRQLLSAKKN
ncbi:MAG: DUF4124 domain-containing protein [Gammaproteobacteria bacterium]|nr:DUF4124 domain-containing protein [Gammaproteobacteria bacterium]